MSSLEYAAQSPRPMDARLALEVIALTMRVEGVRDRRAAVLFKEDHGSRLECRPGLFCGCYLVPRDAVHLCDRLGSHA